MQRKFERPQRRLVDASAESAEERARQAEKWAAEADVRPGEKLERPKRTREKLHGFHVRLSFAELAQLQNAAEREDTSAQRVARKAIREYLAATRKVPT